MKAHNMKLYLEYFENVRTEKRLRSIDFMVKKRKKIALIIMLVIISVSSAFAIIDFNRNEKGLKTLFTIRTKIYRDGGSVEYLGLGYKIISYNVLDNIETGELGRKDNVFGFWTLKYED